MAKYFSYFSMKPYVVSWQGAFNEYHKICFHWEKRKIQIFLRWKKKAPYLELCKNQWWNKSKRCFIAKVIWFTVILYWCISIEVLIIVFLNLMTASSLHNTLLTFITCSAKFADNIRKLFLVCLFYPRKEFEPHWNHLLTLVLLNRNMPWLYKQCSSRSVGFDLHCLSFSMWICIKNLDQVIWLAEN